MDLPRGTTKFVISDEILEPLGDVAVGARLGERLPKQVPRPVSYVAAAVAVAACLAVAGAERGYLVDSGASRDPVQARRDVFSRAVVVGPDTEPVRAKRRHLGRFASSQGRAAADAARAARRSRTLRLAPSRPDTDAAPLAAERQPAPVTATPAPPEPDASTPGEFF
jgi:F0F1-type ATP synthase membrane subunit c/vacuolar-type H+-ATPase subunit K